MRRNFKTMDVEAMMDGEDNRSATIEGLQRLLDVYGADRSRWPARERLRYVPLLAESADARRLLEEARALDALLDEAPAPNDADIDVLATRIMTAAGASPATRPSTVTAFKPRARVGARRSGDSGFGWPAAALLAASLVLGVFAGTTGMVDAPMSALAELGASAPEQDEDMSRLAFDADDAGTFGVEELL